LPETGKELPPAVLILGPTASGKTTAAVELVRRHPFAIISVDSATIYRDMNIGTAKPDPETLAIAPHALIDIRDPTGSYSAAEFREDAILEMHKATRDGQIPLLVGGTMLYFRALLGGLSDLPPASETIRRDLEAEAAASGWHVLHARLRSLDPESANAIHPNDRQRIQRALEVIMLSGEKMSVLQRQGMERSLGYRVLKLVVCPESRPQLHQQIESRFHHMLAIGFMDEMKMLRARYELDARMPSMRCVNYRQAWQYMEEEISRDEMVEKALAATRQLAKRQLTWLRQESDALWYDSHADEAQQSLFNEVARFIGPFLE
jgi:tRNA dimethylallyltransferase